MAFCFSSIVCVALIGWNAVYGVQVTVDQQNKAFLQYDIGIGADATFMNDKQNLPGLVSTRPHQTAIPPCDNTKPGFQTLTPEDNPCFWYFNAADFKQHIANAWGPAVGYDFILMRNGQIRLVQMNQMMAVVEGKQGPAFDAAVAAATTAHHPGQQMGAAPFPGHSSMLTRDEYGKSCMQAQGDKHATTDCPAPQQASKSLVVYAGGFFMGRDKKIKHWLNYSGHFKPNKKGKDDISSGLGLPADKFTEWTPGVELSQFFAAKMDQSNMYYRGGRAHHRVADDYATISQLEEYKQKKRTFFNHGTQSRMLSDQSGRNKFIDSARSGYENQFAAEYDDELLYEEAWENLQEAQQQFDIAQRLMNYGGQRMRRYGRY